MKAKMEFESEKIYETRLFYLSNRRMPQVMRFEISLKDKINYYVLQETASITIKRYPYFKVKLEKRNNDYYFVKINK